MTNGRATIGAAIDAGSNSVHLLVAEVVDGDPLPLADESEFLGLGEVVGRDGRIGDVALGRLLATLQAYVARARDLGAEDVTLLATEPLRRAGDGDGVRDAVQRGTGLPLHVLSHEEEGYLALLGALGGRRPERDTLVIDIGGGSSEWVVTGPERTLEVGVLPTGTDRLTSATLRSDPPTAGELAALRAAARGVVERVALPRVTDAYFLGGTATKLLRVGADGDRNGSLLVDRPLLDRVFAAILAEPAAALVERYRLRLRRAQLLPGGAALVEAMLDGLDLPFGHVSEASLREGTVLAVARAGTAWRTALPSLVGGGERSAA